MGGGPKGVNSCQVLCVFRVHVGSAVSTTRIKETRELSRIGSGGVQNLTGRFGLDQEPFKYNGSGRITLTRSNPREVIPLVKTPAIYPCPNVLLLNDNVCDGNNQVYYCN